MAKEKLSNLYDIGSSKRVFQSEWKNNGVPFYRAREIARLSEDGFVDNELFIDEELYKEYTEKYGKPQPGDIMVTGVGTLGVCYIVKPDDKFYFKDGNILWFKQKAPDRIIPEYLVKSFASKEIKDYISKNSSGTTVGTLTIQTANKMEISLPSLEHQKEIIECITQIESIIKKRKEELEVLDRLIKARFVEMFGTFPNNEKGWPIGKIRDLVADVRYGSSRKAADGENGKYPYLRMNNITYNGELDLKDIKTIDIPENELPKCSVQRGDVLFYRTNSKELVGKTCVYNREELMVLAGFIIRIRLNEKALPEFVSAFLNTDFSKQMLLGMCKAAIGQANINATEMQNIGVYIPPVEEQNRFVKFKYQVDKSKFINCNK